jgi:hypothetical protein
MASMVCLGSGETAEEERKAVLERVLKSCRADSKSGFMAWVFFGIYIKIGVDVLFK